MDPGDYRIVAKHSDSSGQTMQLELFHFPAVYEYEAGTYRIVMKTKPSGWTSAEFTLTMPAINEALGLQEDNSYRMDYLPEKQISDISLQIEKESYSGSKDTEIVYTLQNHGETSVAFYPRLVSLEVKREDGWYTFMGGSTLLDTVVDEGIEVRRARNTKRPCPLMIAVKRDLTFSQGVIVLFGCRSQWMDVGLPLNLT